jgi:apolipoprotein N-acyltransferase
MLEQSTVFENSRNSTLLIPVDHIPLTTTPFELADQLQSSVAVSTPSQSAGTAGPKLNPRKKASGHLSYINTLAILMATCLNALPWLVDGAVWLGVIGVILALWLSTRVGFTSSLLVTWLWCTCSVGIAFHWSPATMAYTLSSGIGLGILVAAPLIMWDGLRMALGYWIAARVTKDIRYQWLAAATCAIVLEYAMPGVFPWKIGCVLLPIPWSIQAVDIFGPSFSTLVVFAIAGMVQISARTIWNVCRPRKVGLEKNARLSTILHSPALVFLTLNFVYSGFAWSYWQSQSESAKKVRLGLIQVDPSYKESPARLQEFTGSVGNQVDLICWPESSGGNYELQLDNFSDSDRVFRMSRSPARGLRPWPNPKCEVLLAGKNYVGDPDQPEQLFVTAMLIDCSESIVARYNKRFLMPFGEYVPCKDFVPGLTELFDMDEKIQPGSSCSSLASLTGARIGTLLCYEDMVPRASRDAVAQNANLLISLINGSAFESRFTISQHRQLAQMRALESRRYFARCASTGETCIVNPLGEIESRLPLQTNGVLIGDVKLIEGRTIYSRYPWCLPIVGFGLLAIAFLFNSKSLQRLSPADRLLNV